LEEQMLEGPGFAQQMWHLRGLEQEEAVVVSDHHWQGEEKVGDGRGEVVVHDELLPVDS
jgi:hypothetical protein